MFARRKVFFYIMPGENLPAHRVWQKKMFNFTNKIYGLKFTKSVRQTSFAKKASHLVCAKKV